MEEVIEKMLRTNVMYMLMLQEAVEKQGHDTSAFVYSVD